MSAHLCLALDVPDTARAVEWVRRTSDQVELFKVGLELFCAEGPAVVRAVRAAGARGVFLDLKLLDIPNTVAGAVRSVTELGVDLLTVHVSGGPEMLARAVEAAGARGPRLLGVTVLTSLDATEAEVLARGRAGVSAGLGGLVCSAREVAAMRATVDPDSVLVTPGIRLAPPAAGPVDDQARVASPQAAVAAGADVLVVGRAVTAAPDPEAALATLRAAVA